MGGLEANLLLQIQGGPFAYLHFSFSGNILLCVSGVIAKGQARIRPSELIWGRGCAGEDLEAFHLP